MVLGITQVCFTREDQEYVLANGKDCPHKAETYQVSVILQQKKTWRAHASPLPKKTEETLLVRLLEGFKNKNLLVASRKFRKFPKYERDWARSSQLFVTHAPCPSFAFLSLSCAAHSLTHLSVGSHRLPPTHTGAIQQYIWNPSAGGTLFLHYRSPSRTCDEG